MQTNQINVLTINIDLSWKRQFSTLWESLWVMVYIIVHVYYKYYTAICIYYTLPMFIMGNLSCLWGLRLWLDQAGSRPYRVVVSCNSVHGYVCIGECMVGNDIGGFCCPRDCNVEAALCRVLALTASPLAESKVKLKTVVVCYVFIAWL